ncbi:MAG: ROK family protein [Acidobacteriaceae bacterium]|nr:ROK family protein [Acidobacteriaceae bacterium]
MAVDVGGSHVSCGAVNDRELLEVCSIGSDGRGRLANLLPALARTLRALGAQNGSSFDGIGFGFCGLVDSAAGRIVSTNHKYSDAIDIDLLSWAHEEFDLPLILENDARLALLGERNAGAAQNSNDVVMITLGTGIGTAAIMGGCLVRGKHFQAGCLGGHFTIVAGGRVCSCGARGCFEAEASTYALPDVCKTWPGFEASPLAHEEKLDFATLFAWADKGDAVAGEIRSRCIQIWAACALSLVHAYDPELLILGGGVMKSSYPILRTIQQHIDSYAWTPWGTVRISAAQLGSTAALLGAVPLFQGHR